MVRLAATTSGPGRHELARLGQDGAAAAAIDEVQPEPPLQRAHPLARGRLADADLRRRPAEAPAPADQHEQLQRVEIRDRGHVHT
jgi:hypothetical protein